MVGSRPATRGRTVLYPIGRAHYTHSTFMQGGVRAALYRAFGDGHVNLVLGAGGFIGQRLIAELAAAGRPVRGLVRDEAAAHSIEGRGALAIRGDLMTGEGIAEAFGGVRVVYYLVHSLRSGSGFASRDALAAERAIDAARAAGVMRIVYVGGLGSRQEAYSLHLRSRFDVERRIRSAGLP